MSDIFKKIDDQIQLIENSDGSDPHIIHNITDILSPYFTLNHSHFGPTGTSGYSNSTHRHNMFMPIPEAGKYGFQCGIMLKDEYNPDPMSPFAFGKSLEQNNIELFLNRYGYALFVEWHPYGILDWTIPGKTAQTNLGYWNVYIDKIGSNGYRHFCKFLYDEAIRKNRDGILKIINGEDPNNHVSEFNKHFIDYAKKQLLQKKRSLTMNPNHYCPLGGMGGNRKTIQAREITGPCVGIYDKDAFERAVQKAREEHPGATVTIKKRDYDCIPTAIIQ